MKVKFYYLLSVILITSNSLFAQNYKTVDLSFSFGKLTTTSLSAANVWSIDKKNKLQMGIGARFTAGFTRSMIDFETAPAKFVNEATGPAVFFTDIQVENIDTIKLTSPQINSLNLYYTIQYKVSK